MINQQTLQGNWNEIKGKLRTKWGQLTEDELERMRGNADQLVGMIQKKTGEARDSVEKFFDSLSSDSASAVSRAGEAVRSYAHQAAETAQETGKQAAEVFRGGYEEAEQFVKQRPVESLAVCFGAGLIIGLTLGCLMQSE